MKSKIVISFLLAMVVGAAVAQAPEPVVVYKTVIVVDAKTLTRINQVYWSDGKVSWEAQK